MKSFTVERQELVMLGWCRQDRHNEERWLPPADDRNPYATSFASARRRTKTVRKHLLEIVRILEKAHGSSEASRLRLDILPFLGRVGMCCVIWTGLLCMQDPRGSMWLALAKTYGLPENKWPPVSKGRP